MADELTISASLTYADSEDTDFTLAVAQLLATVSSKKFIHHKQSIGTSEEALDLGEVTSLGWFIGINRDSTNYLELRTATGSTKFAKLRPGKVALFEFGSGVSAPFAVADTAACQLEYVIVSQ